MAKNRNTDDPKQTPPRKQFPKWFYLIAAALPVLFLLLLEAGLRAGGYGADYPVFSKISSFYPDLLFFDPGITKKYFPDINNPPGTIADGFSAVKQENTYRVFVLGESSTAGWPFVPNASFPRYLRRRLERSFPDKNIEVVNLGVSAINSYTLRDITPAVIEQQPDVVIIYTGHNEYYGALGVGSTQTLGGNRHLINFALSLQEWRTVQLVQNIIQWAWKTVSTNDKKTGPGGNETLMSRMIGENLIPYGSTLFERGREQFKGNMIDILAKFKDAGIPVVISTVASNLSGIKPFISVSEGSLPKADAIYHEARQALRSGDSITAKQLFVNAKDLDALRFRAPDVMNADIKLLAREYGAVFADADSAINANSPKGIAGSNIMVDHLHPNTLGYQIIGETVYRAMQNANLLPGKGLQEDNSLAWNSMLRDFPFTEVDSVTADLRIRILTGAFPFVPKGQPNTLLQSFIPKNRTDTLAMMILDSDISWEKAHLDLAEYYGRNGDFERAMREYNTVLADRPYNPNPYYDIINLLIAYKRYPDARRYLMILDRRSPGAFSKKWLGSIALDGGDVKTALLYLEASMGYSQSDPQVLYNLAGAYYLSGNVEKAISTIEQCIAINRENGAAQAFYRQLLNLRK